jgi:osmoprotectant transport system substrate-binding protein
LRVAAWICAALVASLVGACGGSDPAPKTTAQDAPIRIGSKNFTEAKILGELYKQALEAKGLSVELRSAVGPSETVNRALRKGLLDMYPEYVGVLLSEVDGIVKRPASAKAAYALAKGVEENRKLTLLAQTSFSNENALAVTKSFGRRRGVSTIPDLKNLHGATLLAAPEFADRFEGMVGLRSTYGLRSLKMKAWTSAGDQYRALDSGASDVALVFTTDSQLASGRYRLLADPEGLFAEQHLAPVISQQELKTHGPRLAAAINAVSALLTTPVMRGLNAQVDVEQHTPGQVAGDFLSGHGLK